MSLVSFVLSIDRKRTVSVMGIDFSSVWTLCYSAALNYPVCNSQLPNIAGRLSASHQGLFPSAGVAFACPGVQGEGKRPASSESSSTL